MTVKEYLQQYAEAVRFADRLRREYEKELDLIDAVRSVSDNDGMPHGTGIRKQTEEKAIRLADKALALKEAELEAIRIRQKVFDLVSMVPGEKGDVLYERYIQLVRDNDSGRIRLKTWGEVAKAVGYSKSRAHDLHNEALEFLKDRTQSDS